MIDPKIYPRHESVALDDNESVVSDATRSKKKLSSVHIKEEQASDVIEDIRISLKNYVENSTIGQSYNIFIVYLSILSALQCIVQTYYAKQSSLANIFDEIEMTLAIIFLVDWALLLFLAERKLTHLKSFYCVVDLCTCIPIFLTYHATCPSYNDALHGTVYTILFYVLCGLSRIRILRALRLRRRFLAIEDEVDRFVAEIALFLVLLILFNSAVMQYLEPHQDLPFHIWTYYSVVTISTIGYGDISPIT